MYGSRVRAPDRSLTYPEESVVTNWLFLILFDSLIFMNVQKLNALFTRYVADIPVRGEVQHIIPFSVFETFQYHWDLEHKDFERMFDDSLAGDCDLWEAEDYHPKQSMLYYISQNHELVRSMFRDLFDENRDLIGRLHRFIDQCDQLRTYHSKGITKRESHYHGDKKMVFLYLALRFPDIYSLFYPEGFEKTLALSDGKPVGPTLDLERYKKTSKTIGFLMNKNIQLADYIQNPPI